VIGMRGINRGAIEGIQHEATRENRKSIWLLMRKIASVDDSSSISGHGGFIEYCNHLPVLVPLESLNHLSDKLAPLRPMSPCLGMNQPSAWRTILA